MMKKSILAPLFFALLTVKSWASGDIPVEQNNIEPPPQNAPIDSYLTIALITAVVLAGYYFNGRSKSLLNKR